MTQSHNDAKKHMGLHAATISTISMKLPGQTMKRKWLDLCQSLGIEIHGIKTLKDYVWITCKGSEDAINKAKSVTFRNFL